MVVYHETLSGTVTPRTLGPYEFIATPPQQLVLDAILSQANVGDCISPGVRGLSDATGVSRGLITDCLRTLANDGWIDYDGRSIVVLRDPADEDSDRSPDRSVADEPEAVIDQVIDQVIDHLIAADLGDRSGDRSLAQSPILAAAQRHTMRQNGDLPMVKKSDRSPDRSLVHMEDDQVTTTSPVVVVHESSTTGGSGGNADRSLDRSHPAAQVMAELGAEPQIIADALAARPGWTPQQVRDRWDYDARRIAASDGHLTEGVFFHALRCGQLAPARRDTVDWAALARAAADDTPLETGESLHDRAARLIPSDPTNPHAGRDFMWMQQQLAMQDWTDKEALQALADRRRPRGAP